MPLTLFEAPIGSHQASELNDALYTLLGELTAQPHPALAQEAEAIVSTMLNRLKRIAEARKEFAAEKPKLESATRVREEALKAFDSISKNPSAIKKDLKAKQPKWSTDQINAEYARQLKAAQDAYKRATEALGNAQTSLRKANDKKTSAESYVSSSARTRANATLTDVCTAPGPGGTFQYMGYEGGKKHYRLFPTYKKEDQARHEKRWNAGRAAVEKLVRNPALCKPYIEFRSNENGKRKLSSKETRIGGNDFW